jgi:hypothetical protein
LFGPLEARFLMLPFAILAKPVGEKCRPPKRYESCIRCLGRPQRSIPYLSCREILVFQHRRFEQLNDSVPEQVRFPAVIESECHLVQVRFQMLRTQAMPRPHNAPLEQREGRFNRPLHEFRQETGDSAGSRGQATGIFLRRFSSYMDWSARATSSSRASGGPDSTVAQPMLRLSL